MMHIEINRNGKWERFDIDFTDYPLAMAYAKALRDGGEKTRIIRSETETEKCRRLVREYATK